MGLFWHSNCVISEHMATMCLPIRSRDLAFGKMSARRRKGWWEGPFVNSPATARASPGPVVDAARSIVRQELHCDPGVRRGGCAPVGPTVDTAVPGSPRATATASYQGYSMSAGIPWHRCPAIDGSGRLPPGPARPPNEGPNPEGQLRKGQQQADLLQILKHQNRYQTLDQMGNTGHQQWH